MTICTHHKIREIVIPMYHAEELGITGVYLKNAVLQETCEVCGYVKSVAIPNLQGLIAAVAVSRVMSPFKLHGPEIRFLREAVEKPAKELAAKLEVLPTQISRWENAKEPISPRSEKLLRLYVLHELAGLTKVKSSRSAIFDMKIRAWRPLAGKMRMVFYLEKPAGEASTGRRRERWMELDEAA